MKSWKWATAGLLAAVLGLGGLAGLGTFQADARQKEDETKGPAKAEDKSPATKQSPRIALRKEEQNLRKAAQDYAAAFNKADLDTLGDCWTDDAEYTSEAGKTTRSREAMRRLLKQSLADSKGAKQTIKVRSVRFIKPDVACVEGTAFMTSDEGSIEPGPFSSVWVKQDGKWRISTLRDLPDSQDQDQPIAHSHLKQLAWLVGEWQEKGADGGVRFTCKWGPNQSFLIQEFTAPQNGGTEFRATQIIGWDPIEEKIRSWVFDSSGGFGGELWERHGNTWEIDSGGVFPDGRLAGAMNRWKYVDDKTAEWSSTNRQADEMPLPDVNVTFVRKAKTN
jgi:uncharacterized protein (TIGR02246 family)